MNRESETSQCKLVAARRLATSEVVVGGRFSRAECRLGRNMEQFGAARHSCMAIADGTSVICKGSTDVRGGGGQ